MNPIQSRTTGYGFTLMSFPKGKNTCYTLFVLAFFFGENGSEENTGCGFVHTSEYMERNGDPGGIRMNEKQERCSSWSVLSGGAVRLAGRVELLRMGSISRQMTFAPALLPASRSDRNANIPLAMERVGKTDACVAVRERMMR